MSIETGLDQMVEGDGTYTQQNRVTGLMNADSGGNTIFVTPSLWVSAKQFFFQFGVGLPIVQNLYGNQPRDAYLVAVNSGWRIG